MPRIEHRREPHWGDMQRRGRSAQPAKGERIGRPKAPKASTAHAAAADLKKQLDQRARELDEVLQQQSATSEVLRVISHSPTELQSVLNMVGENAARLCDANNAVIYRQVGNLLRQVASYGGIPTTSHPSEGLPVSRDTVTGRAVCDHQTIHVHNLASEDREYPVGSKHAKRDGHRTTLATPLLREGEPIGAILIRRMKVRPFSDKQIALLETFATQAVIAIENTRVLNELHESLEQQTATSEVLKVISSSPSDLKPVFQSMLENSVRICEAKFGQMFLYEGDKVRFVAAVGVPKALIEFDKRRGNFQPSPGGGLDRVTRTKQVIHIADVTSVSPSYPPAKLGGARSYIGVPMIKEKQLIGAIAIYRQEVQPFTDKQIELVKNFAAQAVIAIENARLLNELRQRTNDLTESLEQQTATSEVLRVISSSPGELEPVFQAMLENARRICEAEFGVLYRCEGEALRVVAIHGAPQAFVEERRRNPLIRPPPQTALGRVIATKQPVQIADVVNEPNYFDVPSGYSPVVLTKLSGARTVLAVPMLKENELVGAFVIFRQEVRPFTDKQIELVKNFAAQAVIAIENARLLDDLNKLNQQLEQRVTDQVSEIERMGKLRRFLPPQVADLIVASGTEKQLESHRREITALFCDLRGFTGFSESSDPEDVMALLRDYHAAIGEIINRYGGTLERYAGDGVMVVFNDPIPVDNPALQAVWMAIDMRAAIGELIEKWCKLGHDIGFGIGIAHGFATLGTIGFEGRFDYAAIGTVSNVASRLCDEAKSGQILISPRVLMAVEKDITVEPVGDFALKGIRRPLTAYNVLATKAAN